MGFIDIPTEQTTAVTDVILALAALFLCLYINRIGRKTDKTKARIWIWAFGLLTVASALGAAAHGFQMSEQVNRIIWQPIKLALGLTIAMFVVGVVYDMRRFSFPRILTPIILAIGLLFYIFTLIVPGTFIVFILYEAVAMLFALSVYTILAMQGKLTGSLYMGIGILVTIAAAAVQATGTIHVKLIWEFDHNGVFHILQLVGLVFLLFGLRSELLARGNDSPK